MNRLYHSMRPKDLTLCDVSQREGKYTLPPGAPKTMGVEFSGTVDELGEGVSNLKVGDEVLGLTIGVRIFRLM